MQAVIALCYFCENHGPRVVMICQPMRNNGREKSIDLTSNDDAMDTTDEDTPRFYGDLGSIQDEVIDEEERCAACSSFGSGLGILSNDHEAETSYVSTQVPVNERLHSIIKQACLRSLSVEISTPLFVETDSNYHVLEPLPMQPMTSFASHSNSNCGFNHQPKEFADKDGVVLFGDDENGYTLSHTFRLKDAKARGFNRSYSLVVISRDKLLLLSNYEFFLGGFSAMIAKLQSMACETFAMEQRMDSELRLATQNVNRSSWLPHRFYPRHFALDTSRSLTEITNCRDIFVVLHRQMLYLLKTQTTLEQDTVLEGVPTQDMLVAMEMERSSTGMEENDLITATLSTSTPDSLRHLHDLRVVAERLRDVPDLHDGDDSLLSQLLWHVIVGGQVVVRSDLPEARRLLLLALINLLPVGCVRLASNASVYHYAYKYNFLGCSSTVIIPDEVQPELLTISIFSTESGPSTSNGTSCNGNCGDAATLLSHPLVDDGHIGHYEWRVETHPRRRGGRPRLLCRYMELLLDPVLNVFTLESVLRATRNDWLNNAKLIFQLRHQREGIDINRIIRIIKCGPEDSPVLLFWQSGLSRRYKQVVLNTITSSAAGSGAASVIAKPGGDAGKVDGRRIRNNADSGVYRWNLPSWYSASSANNGRQAPQSNGGVTLSPSMGGGNGAGVAGLSSVFGISGCSIGDK